MSFRQRTHDCGALRAENAGQTVTVNGWAHRVRDLGGLYFVDLRDRTGIIQLFFPEGLDRPDIRHETCLSVTGKLEMRAEAHRNVNIPTGQVELIVESYEILNACAVLPFPVSDETQMSKVNEDLRVKYRYLDLRRPFMYERIALRSSLVTKIRSYLDKQGFLEIETPIFTKSTPEGARDYLIPYRLEPGKFYALPQSPQQYKQLLMVAGIERYYQICKCFRDESQRSDRQPEFTQLDLEMSFVTQDQVLDLMEGMVISVMNDLITEYKLDREKVEAFPRMTHAEAMLRFGSDKPDIRFGLELFDISDIVKESGFGVFKNTIAAEGFVRGIRFPGGHSLSRKDIGEYEQLAKEYGAKGMATLAVEDPAVEVESSILTPKGRRFRSSIVKFMDGAELDAIYDQAQAETGDLLLFIADEWSVTCEALNRLRLKVGDACNLRDPRQLKYLYVVDFPLVEWNADERRWDPSHHPFTSPKAEDMHLLDVDPSKVRADCYDLVCNGLEMASGSIRIHQPDVQAKIFTLIGVSEEQQQSRFGHILEAFTYGAPPHGGIAPGIDRMVMRLLNEDNIREIIVFPKMGNGYDPLMDSPSEIDELQWKEMGLQVTPVPKV